MMGNEGNGVGGKRVHGMPKSAKAATKPCGSKGKTLQAPGAGSMTGKGKYYSPGAHMQRYGKKS